MYHPVVLQQDITEELRSFSVENLIQPREGLVEELPTRKTVLPIPEETAPVFEVET
jgi:hypothetical protein